MRLAAIALLALGPCACASAVDAQRAQTCRRAIPALAPAGASPTVLRVATGAAPNSVQVDYDLPGAPGRRRWALCRFGPGAILSGVATERGELGGAALYLLQRYYLDTPDAAAAEP